MIVSLSNTSSRKYNKETQGELPLFFVHPESFIMNFKSIWKKKKNSSSNKVRIDKYNHILNSMGSMREHSILLG